MKEISISNLSLIKNRKTYSTQTNIFQGHALNLLQYFHLSAYDLLICHIHYILYCAPCLLSLVLHLDCDQEETYYPGLWERAIEDPSNSISEQGLHSAVQQLLANDEASVVIHSYEPMYQLAVRSGYCNWGFLNDRFYHNYWSFPMPKGSPFVSTFNRV